RGRGDLLDALGLARVVGTAQPDGRRRHALVADRASAFRARETGLAVGMPIAVARGRRQGGVTSVSRVHVHVAYTPAEEGSAHVGIVVDVVRATSSSTAPASWGRSPSTTRTAPGGSSSAWTASAPTRQSRPSCSLARSPPRSQV